MCDYTTHNKKRAKRQNETRTINQRLKDKEAEEKVVLEYAQRYEIDISEEYQQLKGLIIGRND